jgi:uncharacterized RDD family membrane protein YckC
MRWDHSVELEYVGFWSRILASLIDSILLAFVTIPLLLVVYGRDYFAVDVSRSGGLEFVIAWVLPALATIWFWSSRHATPGKMAISAVIIDERTGQPPTLTQHLGRYFAYFLSALPLGLGFLWIAIDVRKQGWHDKLAGTLVVRMRKSRLPVRFGS